ncbi:hypothetical protein D3C71_2004670 [compost metagenome]
MMAFFNLQAKPRYPVIQPGLAQHCVGVEHRRQFGNIEKRRLQAVTQALFQRTGQHALVEWRVKRQHRAVANESEQVEQGLGRVATGGQGARAQAMD